MPFVANTITAKSVEQFKRLEESLTHLNTLVQTLNNKNIEVRVSSLFGMGATVEPTYGKIVELRIHPDAVKEFWVDYNVEKKEISIRAKPDVVYTIKMESADEARKAG